METRPKITDDRVAHKAAEALWPKVKNWLVSSGESSEDAEADKERILEQIEDAIGFEEDGFKIGRNLDRNGWDVDFELTELLDSVGFAKREAVEALEVEWVTANDIKPTRRIGDAVQVSLLNKGWKEETVDGIISAIHSERGKYTVFCEKLGHVRNGVGTHGVIVPFEKVYDP